MTLIVLLVNRDQKDPAGLNRRLSYFSLVPSKLLTMASVTSPGDNVQVTILNNEATAPPLARLLELLNENERRRARLFHRPAVFITARAALRVVLGRHLGVRPAEVDISAGGNGKPVLRGGGPAFNLSHTQGMVAIAVRDRGPVGIDVETTMRKPPRPGVLERTLTAAELRDLRGRPPDLATAGFLEVWTRKEAYAKGLSVGLGLDFRTVEVGWGDTVIDDDPPWEVRSLTFPPSYVGAVAAEGRGWDVGADDLIW